VLKNTLIHSDRVPDGLVAALDRRDVAFWIRDLPKEASSRQLLEKFLGLPWRLILSEIYDARAFRQLETETTFNDPMTRRRGFAQIIDSDPTRTELPERCLPVYLLNGRAGQSGSSDFASRLRRMTMLDALRRSGVRDLFVISTSAAVPPDLADLWASGFRCRLTFVSDDSNAEKEIADWLAGTNSNATLLSISSAQAIEGIYVRFTETYPEERRVLRIRDAQGTFQKIDVTEVDEPERPILESYSLIEERDLAPLLPEDLTEENFVGFFRDSTSSWRPYAAGLPWLRDQRCRKTLGSYLAKLDAVGADENCIAYISSESGAGGTTLARALAWECAREGYPVLLANQVPFSPDALPITNFLNRIRGLVSDQAMHENESTSPREIQDPPDRHYESPWMIVFDTLHWQQRDGELIQFLKEFERAGRPVCLLVVTGSVLDPSFRENSSSFKRLTTLNHALELSEAIDLGDHLNTFLRLYGKQRERWHWERFYREHTVQYLEGTAAFWVVLSFWIQGQYDLSESIQEWMYRAFTQNAGDAELKAALLRIAAMSTERLPLPERLLPASNGPWPISYALEEARPSLAALGLTRISSDEEKYWALIHDILGRFLINALFYDATEREQLGFGASREPEHLRFTLLRQISREPLLGERSHRGLGEDFATSIFKIDQEYGRNSFAPFWRDVLEALAEMPRSLRDTSRLFRHHVAISKRRIAKLDERLYQITHEDKLALIRDAIEDLKYALVHIEYTPGAETNLNLLNSLARAYFDLADAEAAGGAPRERILEIRRLANEATRRAYDENPTNSFVIETYVKNLLHTARESSAHAVETCIEILGIISSALTSKDSAYRESQLSSLADEALGILLQQTSQSLTNSEPRTPIDVLVLAWQALAENDSSPGISLADVPDANRTNALEVLAHDAGKGSTQVITLRYNLICISHPFAFKQQLELVEQLAASHKVAPQLRLEYAVLLFQNGRAPEGDKTFRTLRQLWRESEYFVEVPERLRWLRGPDGRSLKTVKATVSSDYGTRAMARVLEFGSALVPFRPEEHGLRNLRVGTGFTCHVSFGHNGPFLRPVTAGAHG
jgi:hypothetical protein